MSISIDYQYVLDYDPLPHVVDDTNILLYRGKLVDFSSHILHWRGPLLQSKIYIGMKYIVYIKYLFFFAKQASSPKQRTPARSWSSRATRSRHVVRRSARQHAGAPWRKCHVLSIPKERWWKRWSMEPFRWMFKIFFKNRNSETRSDIRDENWYAQH